MSDVAAYMCREEADVACNVAPVSTLDAAEARIAKAAAGFFADACCALLDIHDGKLYKQAG